MSKEDAKLVDLKVKGRLVVRRHSMCLPKEEHKVAAGAVFYKS
jgi:hypothetical protein